MTTLMPRLPLVVLILAWTSMAVIAGPPFGKTEQKPTVAWQPNLKSAHVVANETNRPMLLVFGATWCGPCKKLERETLAHPELAEYLNGHFVSVHLDLDEEQRAAEILEVTHVPCVVILSPNADLLGKQTGFKDPQEFYEMVIGAEQILAQQNSQQPRNVRHQPAAVRSAQTPQGQVR